MCCMLLFASSSLYILQLCTKENNDSINEIDEHVPRLEEKDMSCWVGWQKPHRSLCFRPQPRGAEARLPLVSGPTAVRRHLQPHPKPCRCCSLSALLPLLSLVLRTSWLVVHWVFHPGECFIALHTSPDPRLMNKGWKYTQMSSWAIEQMSNTVCRSWLEAAEPKAGASFHLLALCGHGWAVGWRHQWNLPSALCSLHLRLWGFLKIWWEMSAWAAGLYLSPGRTVYS